MNNTIDNFLKELEAQLINVTDPAVIQDALYDAEEYLRSAAIEAGSNQELFNQRLQEFGSPQEIASSYIDAELIYNPQSVKTPPAQTERNAYMNQAPAPAPSSAPPTMPLNGPTMGAPIPPVHQPINAPQQGNQNPFVRFYSIFRDTRAWSSLAYFLIALPLGILYFTFAVTGFSLSISLLILIIGVVVASAFLASTRGIALIEGRLVESLLGERMPRRPRGKSPEGIVNSVKYWIKDRRTWTTMAYMALQMPLGILYFTFFVMMATLSIGFIASPVIVAAATLGGFDTAGIINFGPPAHLIPIWGRSLILFAAGAVMLPAILWAAKGAGKLHGSYAKAMLVNRYEE